MKNAWANPEKTIGNIIFEEEGRAVVIEPGHPLWEDFILSDPEPYIPVEVPVVDPLEIERAGMTLSFSQFLVGLVEQGWISEAEANAWLSGNALPAAVEAAIATLPETAQDGTKPRLRARARSLRPSAVTRTNDLLLMMASLKGVTPGQLDDFFRIYCEV